MMKCGDTVLVCDAGGGTSVQLFLWSLMETTPANDKQDVSIMEIIDVQEKVPQFRQMCRVDGCPPRSLLWYTYLHSTAVAVGSTDIDDAFDELVKSRLRHLDCKVNHAASGDEFQTFKTKVGTDSVDLLSGFLIQIPGLNKNIDDSKAQITKGSMKFTR
jgi:hypothetical protein